VRGPELDLELGYRALFRALPVPCLLLDRQLRIQDANPAYLSTVGREHAYLVGRLVSEVFPAGPADREGPGAVEVSMRRALAGQANRLPLLRYDVEDAPGSGRFVERWWAAVNVPVLAADGSVLAVLDVVEDVTEVVREREQGELAREEAGQVQLRVQGLQADLQARSQELASTVHAEAVASRRLAALAGAALELAAAETLEDLVDVVIGRGMAALGADGGAVAVADETGGTLRLTRSDSLGASAEHKYAQVPLDSPLPVAVAARTGRPVLLEDRQAGLAFTSELADVYAATGKSAYAFFPLRVGTEPLGALVVGWDEPRNFPQADVDLIAAFAAQCAQALHRLLLRQAERAVTAATRGMSETLQRSLLTSPPQLNGLEIVVRYQPAARDAQVGGDWYDAFVIDGITRLVVGDVAGHDRSAAATMGELRNLLRGVAHATRGQPAAVLRCLDEAMADLDVTTVATAVLAHIEPPDEEADPGSVVLRWSNAGHPPPLHVSADGTARFLDADPELLMGVDAATQRRDHAQVLEAGTTVLLFTDGLVERRDATLDDGLRWLRRRASCAAALPLPQLCDALLREVDDRPEDDVVLLALRVHPGPPGARER